MSKITWRQGVFHWVAFVAGIGMVIMVAVFLARERAWCHWLPRHARSMYASIRLNIPDEEWGRFRAVLADIGRDTQLSIEDRSQSSQSGVDVLDMSLCAADGRALLVIEYPSVGSAPECRRDCGVAVFVYGRAETAQPLTPSKSRDS
nr:hypothetical protein [uncultured Steroidobacter sp.]